MIELFEEFCNYLIETKGSKGNTLASYERDIKAFIIYLHSNGIYSLDKIDNSHIENYVSYLKKHGKSASTISRNLSSLRCFFKYLTYRKIVLFNPMIGVKNEKTIAKLPETLTSNDVDTLLAAPDLGTVKGIRDKAMLEIMYATGIRVTELLEINRYNCNLDVGYVIIKGENKERVIPLYPVAVEALNNYINNSRDKLLGDKRSDILFLNSNGDQMTRQGFWKIVKCYANAVNIDTDITPKILRHSFATHLLENGADINVIKDMLGHTVLSSTKVYAKIIQNKYMNVYSDCHPRAKK